MDPVVERLRPLATAPALESIRSPIVVQRLNSPQCVSTARRAPLPPPIHFLELCLPSYLPAGSAEAGRLAATQKLSVSIAVEAARRIRASARRKRKTLSAVLTEAIATVRQMEVRREFLARFEPGELATDTEADEVRRQWRG